METHVAHLLSRGVHLFVGARRARLEQDLPDPSG